MFAISLYQALLYFAVIVFAADLLKRVWGSVPTIGRAERSLALWYSAILIVALPIYASIAIGFIDYANTEFSHAYYFHPKAIAQHGATVFATTLGQIWQIYSGAAPSFLGENLYYRLLVAVCVAVLAWSIFATWRQSVQSALLVVALLVAILLAPFLQHPLNGGYLPYRALVGVPVAVAVLVLFAAERSTPKLRNWLLLPLAALLVLELSTINNRQYYAGHWQLERDKALAAQIIARVQEKFPGDQAYTLGVVGLKPVKHDTVVPDVRSSTLGASFFSWDGGRSSRIAMFFNFLSDSKFRPASRAQTLLILETTGAMPSWPAAGSIDRVGDVVVIKLSEPSQRQISLACRHRKSEFCAQHGY